MTVVRPFLRKVTMNFHLGRSPYLDDHVLNTSDTFSPIGTSVIFVSHRYLSDVSPLGTSVMFLPHRYLCDVFLLRYLCNVLFLPYRYLCNVCLPQVPL